MLDKNLEIPLQNLILGKKKTCEFRETLWRTTVVNILLNKNITKLLNEERIELVNTINDIENITFCMDSKKYKKIKFPEFIKKVVKFIIFGIDKNTK